MLGRHKDQEPPTYRRHSEEQIPPRKTSTLVTKAISLKKSTNINAENKVKWKTENDKMRSKMQSQTPSPLRTGLEPKRQRKSEANK